MQHPLARLVLCAKGSVQMTSMSEKISLVRKYATWVVLFETIHHHTLVEQLIKALCPAWFKDTLSDPTHGSLMKFH